MVVTAAMDNRDNGSCARPPEQARRNACDQEIPLYR
jgi:hypothetical protein